MIILLSLSLSLRLCVAVSASISLSLALSLRLCVCLCLSPLDGWLFRPLNDPLALPCGDGKVLLVVSQRPRVNREKS